MRWLREILVCTALVQSAVLAIRVIATYRVIALGGGPAEVGIVAAAFAGIALLVAIPLGNVSDRYGPARITRIGSALVALSALGSLAADSVLTLAIAQAALGVGQLLTVTGTQGTLAARTPTEQRESWFARFTLAASTGHFVGPAIVAILIGAAGTGGVAAAVGPVLLVAAAFGAIGSVLTLRHRDVGARAVAPPMATRDPWFMMRSGPLRTALLNSVAVSAANDLLIAYLPVYGTATGIEPTVVGACLSIYGLAAMGARFLLAHLIDRFGARRTTVTCLIVPAVTLGVLATANEPRLLPGLMLALGATLGIGQPLTLIAVVAAAPRHVHGAALGTRIAANRAAQLSAPILAGGVAAVTGVGAIFYGLSAVLGIAGLMSIRAPASGSREVPDV